MDRLVILQVQCNDLRKHDFPPLVYWPHDGARRCSDKPEVLPHEVLPETALGYLFHVVGEPPIRALSPWIQTEPTLFSSLSVNGNPKLAILNHSGQQEDFLNFDMVNEQKIEVSEADLWLGKRQRWTAFHCPGWRPGMG